MLPSRSQLRTRKHQRQQDIILERKGIQQVEILKDKAEVIAPKRGEFPVFDRFTSFCRPSKATSPAVGLSSDCDHIEQRGLSRTGRAHNGNVFPVLRQ